MRAFLLPMAIFMLISGLVVIIVQPWPSSVPLKAILAMSASIVLSISVALITFLNLQREEVSRVVPILSISPVFTSIIATLFLHERPGSFQWLAILIVAIGAAIISLEKRPHGTGGSLQKPFMLLFLDSLLIAVSNNLSKYALEYVSFWNMYGITVIIASVVFLAISLRPATIRQLKNMAEEAQLWYCTP